MSTRVCFATYEVEMSSHSEFVNLLKETEELMRKNKLITDKEVFRMKSIKNPKLILEIFEWLDENSFKRAQNTESILQMWKQFEKNWISGGFGLDQFPESHDSWAQLIPME